MNVRTDGETTTPVLLEAKAMLTLDWGWAPR